MTRTEIMTKAHSIARTLEGDYTARLSEGLKIAWEESKNEKHPNISKWTMKKIQLDRCIQYRGKAIMVSDEITKGTQFFPKSCVNVINQFEIEVPAWMLRKKGLGFLAA